MEAGPRSVCLHVGLEGRYQAEIVEHRGPQIARESMDDLDRLFDQALGAADVLLDILAGCSRLDFQGGQLHVDAREGLDDLVVELTADRLSLLLLGHQNLVGHLPQLVLHAMRIQKQRAKMVFTPAQGLLRRLPLPDFRFHLPIGPSQLHRPAQQGRVGADQEDGVGWLRPTCAPATHMVGWFCREHVWK